MFISSFTGLLSGIIHVVSGIDHLIAMAPTRKCSPKLAIWQGFSWGIGHSIGIILIAIFSLFIKDIKFIEKLSTASEFLVGIALIFGGIILIKRALKLKIHSHNHTHSGNINHSHIHMHFLGSKMHIHQKTGLGFLHGMAGGSHLIGILPILALSPVHAFGYVAFYLVGSILVMGLIVMLISLANLKSGLLLSRFSNGILGGFSLLIGIFWIKNTFSFSI